MISGGSAERAKDLLRACGLKFGSDFDPGGIASLLSIHPTWEPSSWIDANEDRLRVIIEETSRHMLPPAIVVVATAVLDHDRYALRDHWVRHRHWNDLYLISSSAGHRLPEP